MQEMSHLTAEPVHQRGGRVEREADKVNHDVGTKFRDPVTESALPILLPTVCGNLADLLPFG
ncbi:hypothetical protein GCM10010052_28240 [Paenarthrobacter histidinolovorans]|nr:hypothetical protein GCM10010052_28240 [Paenarthrobacter histidinolovorans]